MTIGSAMPDRKTLIWTLPIRVVLEKDRLGGRLFGVEAVIGVAWTACFVRVTTAEVDSGSGCVTVSCKSCDHCASAVPEVGEG